MIEVIIPLSIVAAMLLVIVIVQCVALTNHKREIAYLREKVKDADQRAERAHRELMRKTGSGVGIAERMREGNRRVEQEAARSAPQAQGDMTTGIIGGLMMGQVLSSGVGNARRNDECLSPPQAPSVESTSPSPSCEAPSPSSSYDSSPSSSSDSGSSFSSGGTD